MEEPINFFSEDIEFEPSHSAILKQWLAQTIRRYGFHFEEEEELNFIFCSDEYLHQINVDYLAHDTYTDIITFDNSEKDKTICGDIFISIPRVIENAAHYQHSFEVEFHRVMVHGVLHLLGFGDKTKSKKLQMRAKETFEIEQLTVILHSQNQLYAEKI
jgi:probable rRNA maturation factor